MEKDSLQQKPTQRIKSNPLSLAQTGSKNCQDKKPNLDVTLTEIESYGQEMNTFFGIFTHLAVKDKKSYMVGNDGGKFKIVEDSDQTWYFDPPTHHGLMYDMIYIDHLDCYFFYFYNNIYRKDINDSPPYIFMKIELSRRPGSIFSYSKINKKLIVAKNAIKVAVINLERKQTEILAKGRENDEILQFRLFGVDENKVICVTKKGYVYLTCFNYDLKKVCAFNTLKLNFIKKRKEIGFSISVSDNNDYALVEISGCHTDFPLCSRMAVVKIKDRLLEVVALLDVYDQKLGLKYALQPCGFFGREMIWVGLNGLDLVQFYAFDSQRRELRELEEKRMNHQEKKPFKMYRIGNEFYYCGRNGKVMRFTISTECLK